MTQHAITTSRVIPVGERQEPSTMQSLWWNVTDSLIITRRNLTYYVRLPQLLVFSTIQPIMFLLLFAYVFGGAIQTGNGEYINFLLPGIIVQTALFGGAPAAIGLAEDLKKGLIDRFRSLPMARSAVLAGRTIADTVRNVFVIFLMLVVGHLIGFRFQNGIFNAAASIVLVLAFGHVFSWIFAFIGMMVKDPETAQVAGFIWIFPLVFASSIFVPVETMPHLLRIFAENQPVSVVASVVRGMMIGTPAESTWLAVAWMAAIYVIFAPLAVWQYRRSAN